MVLSLLLNLLLLGLASLLWWSGLDGGSPSALVLGGGAAADGGRRVGGRRRGDTRHARAPGFASCERPVLDQAKLEEWGEPLGGELCCNMLVPGGAGTARMPGRRRRHPRAKAYAPRPACRLQGLPQGLL